LKAGKQNNKLFCLFTQFQDSQYTLNYRVKKTVPIIKLDLLERRKLTETPAMITPKLIKIPFEAKIILAFICTSSLLFDFYKV
jgi:hypothetical protein